jgi:hypothetical protein
VNAALQIYSKDFDADFFKLPAALQARIQSAIDHLGLTLDRHSHHRMKGVDAFAYGWAITGPSTTSIVREEPSISLQLGIGGKSIAGKERVVLSG